MALAFAPSFFSARSSWAGLSEQTRSGIQDVDLYLSLLMPAARATGFFDGQAYAVLRRSGPLEWALHCVTMHSDGLAGTAGGREGFAMAVFLIAGRSAFFYNLFPAGADAHFLQTFLGTR